MKKIRLILILAVLLSLAMSTAASAQVEEPNAPQAITTWTVSPNPARVQADLALNFAFDFNSPDNLAEFCIYGPANAGDTATNFYGTLPAVITLTLTQSGFPPTIENHGFNKATEFVSTANCGSAYSGYYSSIYNGGSLTLATNTNASGTATVDLDAGSNVASAGSGDWRLLIGDSVGTPFQLNYTHQLVNPSTIYASDSANCGGYGDVGISCFNSLDQAVATADTYDTALVRVVGSLTLDADGTAISGSHPTTLGGISTPIVEPVSGCSGVISVTNGATVQNITIDGTDCPSGTGLTISGSSTVNNVTIQNFSTGTGLNNSNAGTVIQNGRFQSNVIGILTSGTSILNNTIQNNTDDGIQVTGGSATIQDNDIVNNAGDGIQVPPAFSGTIQENHISQSGVYGVNFTGTASGTPTIQWNNIVTSGIGSLRNGSASIFIGGNYFGDNASTGNLGGFEGAVVGSPFNRSTPGINIGNVQVQTIGASGNYDFGLVSITNGTSGPLEFILIDLGNDTPFSVGLDPYQSTQCSNYYDVYIDSYTSSSSPITIRMNVNPGACQLAGGPVDDLCVLGGGSPIRWVNSDSNVWLQTTNVSCADPAPRTWTQGDIAANLLGNTGFAVMGSSTPTSITLTSLTASAARNTWIPAVLIAVSLVGVGALTWLRRKRQA